MDAWQYIERVRRALSPPGIETMDPEEYVGALEEIAADIEGMIEAKREELREEG